jgi:type IV fimbrial biogenesis protein FimT
MHATAHTFQRRRQAGFSLVESLIVLVVLLVSLGAGLPALSDAQDRRRVEGAAALLETELQFTRGLSVARNQNLRFSFVNQGAQSCYVIHTGGPRACTCDGGRTVCTGGAEEVRTVRYDATREVRVASNSASFVFDATHGTVTPTASIDVSSAHGDTVRLVVNVLGRVRDCSPSGFAGRRPC